MNVDGPRALRHGRVGIGQRVFVEQRIAAKAGLAIEGIDIELVLPLHGNKHPRLGRMKIEMPWPEAEPVAGRDGGEIAQHAIVEAECLDRAGILRLAFAGVVAARHQNHGAVVGRDSDLMGIDAGVEVAGLRHRRADGAVGIDAVNAYRARRVVGGEQIPSAGVDASVDRARRQCRRLAMRPQRSGRRIDRKCTGIMFVAGNARSATARHHIQKTP